MTGFNSKREAAADKLQEPIGMLHIERLDRWLDASLKKRKQRKWVGLTDEEIHSTAGYNETRETYQFALALIAKLKERNS